MANLGKLSSDTNLAGRVPDPGEIEKVKNLSAKYISSKEGKLVETAVSPSPLEPRTVVNDYCLLLSDKPGPHSDNDTVIRIKAPLSPKKQKSVKNTKTKKENQSLALLKELEEGTIKLQQELDEMTKRYEDKNLEMISLKQERDTYKDKCRYIEGELEITINNRKNDDIFFNLLEGKDVLTIVKENPNLINIVSPTLKAVIQSIDESTNDSDTAGMREEGREFIKQEVDKVISIYETSRQSFQIKIIDIEGAIVQFKEVVNNLSTGIASNRNLIEQGFAKIIEVNQEVQAQKERVMQVTDQVALIKTKQDSDDQINKSNFNLLHQEIQNLKAQLTSHNSQVKNYFESEAYSSFQNMLNNPPAIPLIVPIETSHSDPVVTNDIEMSGTFMEMLQEKRKESSKTQGPTYKLRKISEKDFCKSECVELDAYDVGINRNMSSLQIKDTLSAYGSEVLVLNIPRFKEELGVYKEFWEHPDSYFMFQTRFSGSKFPRHKYVRLGVKFKDKDWFLKWFKSHHVQELSLITFYHLDECDMLEEVLTELNSESPDRRQHSKENPFKIFLSISSPKVISNITIASFASGPICDIISTNFTNISARAKGVATYLVNEETGALFLDKTNYKFVAMPLNSKVPLNIYPLLKT